MDENKQDLPQDKIIDLSDLIGESFAIKVGDKQYVIDQPDLEMLLQFEKNRQKVESAIVAIKEGRQNTSEFFELLLEQVVLFIGKGTTKEELKSLPNAMVIIPRMLQEIKKRIFATEENFLTEAKPKLETLEEMKEIGQEIKKDEENLKSSASDLL